MTPELQFGREDEKMWSWMVVMIIQQCECT